MQCLFLAYIDPGTGSLIFQMLVASALSAAVVFKVIRMRIVRLFQIIFRIDPKDDEESLAPQDTHPLANADIASAGEPAQPVENSDHDTPGTAS